MTERVLFVDDDPGLLSAYQRALHRRLEIDVASSGEAALLKLQTRGPYAILVTDLHMPRMDGVALLARAREVSPDTIRMMLTGDGDLRTAAEAVNEGRIFRFLIKPCLPQTIERAIEAGLTEHRLVMAERDLLEKTLSGGVHVLTELLALVNPAAFERATRLKRYVRHLARQLKLEDPWRFEMAALLSQLGCVTLPGATLEKICAGEELTPEELTAYGDHPRVGGRLLGGIPRLELVAAMVERQNVAWSAPEAGHSYRGDPIRTGGDLLSVSIDFDDRLFRGQAPAEALLEMHQRRQYDPTMLAALENIHLGDRDLEPRLVRIHELRLHMRLDADVRSRMGMLLVSRGQEVTSSVLECLRNFAGRVGIIEPLKVLVPRLATLDEDADDLVGGEAAVDGTAEDDAAA